MTVTQLNYHRVGNSHEETAAGARLAIQMRIAKLVSFLRSAKRTNRTAAQIADAREQLSAARARLEKL